MAPLTASKGGKKAMFGFALGQKVRVSDEIQGYAGLAGIVAGFDEEKRKVLVRIEKAPYSHQSEEVLFPPDKLKLASQ